MVTLRKKNENKNLVLDDVDENNKVSKKYEEVWEGVEKEIEKIKYGKDYMKIRFKYNDDLPLNKHIKLRLLTIILGLFLVKIINFTLNYF